jgi:hypothetical protein
MYSLFESRSDVGVCLGRTNLWMAAGLCGPSIPPDRLFISADTQSSVHYDSILLLEHLFGELLLVGGAGMLPCSVLTLIEAQTGSIPGHVRREGRPLTSCRSFSENEIEWAQLCLTALTQFVANERNSFMNRGWRIVVYPDVPNECQWHSLVE